MAKRDAKADQTTDVRTEADDQSKDPAPAARPADESGPARGPIPAKGSDRAKDPGETSGRSQQTFRQQPRRAPRQQLRATPLRIVGLCGLLLTGLGAGLAKTMFESGSVDRSLVGVGVVAAITALAALLIALCSLGLLAQMPSGQAIAKLARVAMLLCVSAVGGSVALAIYGGRNVSDFPLLPTLLLGGSAFILLIIARMLRAAANPNRTDQT